MRTILDFAPLWRSTIGFGPVADLVDSALRQPHEDNYPPCNIERTSGDHYRVSLAVAGFGVNDITVSAEQNAHHRGQEPRRQCARIPARGHSHEAIPARVQSRRLRSD
jgi:molecular chaperone IbpA